MVVRGFVVAALVAISAPFVARYYEQPVLESAIQVMAIAFFIIGFTNINTEFQRKELNFKSLAYLQQSTTITSLVVVVALAYFLRSIWALVIGQVISVLVGVILSYALIEGRPTFKFDGVLAKGLLHYGKFITGVAVFGFIASEIDNAVVGKVLGMQALGFYVVAFKLASLPATHFSKVTARMMLPVCSKLQNDLPALRNVYVRVLEFVGHLALPLALGMGILAPELIRALYGEQWLAAVEPLQILCVYGAFMALGSWGYVFNALGKPHIPFYLNVVRAVGIAVLIYPLTAAYGLTGAASAVAIPMVVLFAAQVYAVSRVLEMDKWHILRVLSRVLANSTVMVLALVAARLIVFSSPVLALMFPMGVAGMTYLALNYRNLRAFSTGRILAG
jgi:O-antigen/teichoic acid export membrane protein